MGGGVGTRALPAGPVPVRWEVRRQGKGNPAPYRTPRTRGIPPTQIGGRDGVSSRSCAGSNLQRYPDPRNWCSSALFASCLRSAIATHRLSQTAKPIAVTPIGLAVVVHARTPLRDRPDATSHLATELRGRLRTPKTPPFRRCCSSSVTRLSLSLAPLTDTNTPKTSREGRRTHRIDDMTVL